MRLFNPRKLRYARMLDTVGRQVFRLFGRSRTSGLEPLTQLTPGRILVVESHLIGDIVMATPALRALRERFRSASIVLLSGPWGRELLDGQGLIDEFIEIRFPWSTYDYSIGNLWRMFRVLVRLRKVRWDLAIDVRGDLRNIVFLYFAGAHRRMSYDFTGGEYLLTDVVRDAPQLRHIVQYNAHLVAQLGCDVGAAEPSLHVPDTRREEARTYLRAMDAIGDRFTIGIHPGASKPLRLWRAERFAELADRFLEEKGNRVIFFRGPADREIISAITAGMKHSPSIIDQSLSMLPALFQNCSVFIGLDSGGVHIAAAVGVPTVVLFGPAEPDRVMPVSRRTSVVIKDGYWCRPCDQVHCVQPDNTCMDALSVSSVYQSAIAALNQQAIPRLNIQEHPRNINETERPSDRQ